MSDDRVLAELAEIKQQLAEALKAIAALTELVKKERADRKFPK